MKISGWNLSQIGELVWSAAKESLKQWNKPSLNVQFKRDSSPVTETDQWVESLFWKSLNDPDNGYYLIGEESVDSQSEEYLHNAFKNNAWILDPIDGTSSFANHLPSWGISLALMQNGILCEGILVLPVLGECVFTYNNQVFYASNINFNKPFDPAHFLPWSLRIPHDGMIGLSQAISKNGRYNGPYKVQTLCCSVNSLCNLFYGRYLAYVSAGRIWDFAAGFAILRLLNGHIQLLDGSVVSHSNVIPFFNLWGDHSSPRWSILSHAVLSLNQQISEDVSKDVVLF